MLASLYIVVKTKQPLCIYKYAKMTWINCYRYFFTVFQASTLVHYLCSLKCDTGKVFSTSSFFNIKSSNAKRTLLQILLNTNNINNIYQIFNPSNNLSPQHFTFTVRKTFPSTILFYLFFFINENPHSLSHLCPCAYIEPFSIWLFDKQLTYVDFNFMHQFPN